MFSLQINVILEIIVYDHESLESDTTLGILQYNYIGPKVQNKSITTLPGRKQLEWVESFMINFIKLYNCMNHLIIYKKQLVNNIWMDRELLKNNGRANITVLFFIPAALEKNE